jgi:ketosteroid isomerase-like protein
MSQENVAIVRRTFEVSRDPVRRGDPGAAFVQAVREGILDSNVEWKAGKEGALPLPNADSVGRDGYVGLVRTWTETFDDLVFEAEKIIDADDDRVVVVARARGIGKGSAAPVEVRYGAVYTLEGRRIVRWEVFPKPNQALQAVGLSE